MKIEITDKFVIYKVKVSSIETIFLFIKNFSYTISNVGTIFWMIRPYNKSS
jgi:hypothetical protein